NQELLYETPAALPEDWAPDGDRARRVFAAVRAANRVLLTEVEAKEVLVAYGVPVTPTIACPTEDEAVAAARHLGYAVVVKLLATTITHKSDVGGVQLGLKDDSAMRGAFRTIQTNVQRLSAGSFEGVTVQPMVPDKGYELIVGSSIDRQFGPVILFGAGGGLVEGFKDSALALPPLTRTLARRLIERTAISRALQGGRGQRPVNLPALGTL